MKKVYPSKSSAETLKYGFNWSPRDIGSERIILFDVSVISGGVTILAQTVEDVPNARTGQGTTFVVSGGTPGDAAELLLHIETNAVPPSVLEETVYIPIR